MDEVRKAIANGGTAVLYHVLSGAGGVGKTQLAADYARNALRSGTVDLLVWINAGTRTTAVSGYAQAAVEVLGADPANPERAAEEFLAWLEPKAEAEPCRWLIVLDDITDPADLRGLRPPANLNGRTLVTSRRRDAAIVGDGQLRVPVGLFTPNEATAYLRAALAAHGRYEPAQHLRGLAADLGYLPLALSQAVAYLIDADLNCADYRELLADQTRRLADLLPEPDALPDDQTASVAAAWSLSITRAERLSPAGLARPILQLVAMLDSNGIPDAILTSRPFLAFLSVVLDRNEVTNAARPQGRRSWLWKRQRSPNWVTDMQVTSAIRALHRLNLIDHTPSTPLQAVSIHQLIQRAVRDGITYGQHLLITQVAADAIRAVWPESEREADLVRALHANADALTRHAGDALWQPSCHSLLVHAGQSLSKSGQFTAAVSHHQYLANTSHRRLGPDHPETLAFQVSLAIARGEAGDAVGAAVELSELLDRTLRVLGPKHIHTLTVRGYLAHWRGEAGDAAGAVTASRELLERMRRVLGPKHPHTLAVRGYHAHWQGRAGNAADAVDDFAKLLEHTLQLSGPEHPGTLTIRGYLAHWRCQAGDLAGASTEFAHLLNVRLRVQGPDHRDTLITRGSLIECQGRAGDAAGAAADQAELLEHMLRVLGPDHPDTLGVRVGLAKWRGMAGDAADAVSLLSAAFPDVVRVMGADHPAALAVGSSLTYWRGKSGDTTAAAAAEETTDE
ncbi:tetratricopeptide repeat protein [Kitasatospora sp. NPDC058190]|uniref:tetratricopeptide repeat protein n=1 Tax=Kitasatospora sp. NPDC058190 TaxID=3346371 RepID=UPI0036DAD721